MAEILQVRPEEPYGTELDEAVRVLRSGGVIAFPTDTVYGIGGDALHKATVRKIYRLKGRTRRKPLVLFVPNKEELKKYTKPLEETALRLIDSYLPGPLTLVLPASDQTPSWLVSKGKIGVRIPDHEVVLTLLTKSGRPLATTSANLSNRKPLLSAFEVESTFGEGLDLVLDGGECPSPIVSTVLQLSDGSPTILRKGRVPILSLERVVGGSVKLKRGLHFNVLIVCTGNSCRSPLAEALLQKSIRGNLKHRIRIRSAGTAATEGYPPAGLAIEVAGESDIDISGHRTTPVSPELIDGADLVLVMEPPHKDRLLQLSPEAEPKIDFLRTLGREETNDQQRVVSDPAGGPKEFYIRCVREIEKALPNLIRWLEERLD